jgi:hypothetical protein
VLNLLAGTGGYAESSPALEDSNDQDAAVIPFDYTVAGGYRGKKATIPKSHSNVIAAEHRSNRSARGGYTHPIAHTRGRRNRTVPENSAPSAASFNINHSPGPDYIGAFVRSRALPLVPDTGVEKVGPPPLEESVPASGIEVVADNNSYTINYGSLAPETVAILEDYAPPEALPFTFEGDDIVVYAQGCPPSEPPDLVSPADYSNCIPPSGVTLDWDSVPLATRYKYYWGTSYQLSGHLQG